MSAHKHKGWTISFRRNVHMYCHDLRVSKGGEFFQVPCEDLPEGEGLVGVFPFELKIDPKHYSELIRALHAWAATEGLNYRLYVARDQFETGSA